ncbi:MAG: fibronectin type III domain-containing protein [Kofleriaceae bacterium]
MALFRPVGAVMAGPLILCALMPSAAVGAPGECHVVDIDFKPVKNLTPQVCSQVGDPGHPIACPDLEPQIVVWIETPSGEFVDTVFITEKTGTYGIGNRPGRPDFNSGPRWPYGYRPMVFPVWADRKLPREFDAVVFQNIDENNLSHPFNQSSRELSSSGFCRPLNASTDPGWDTGSCASQAFTDKGTLAPTDNTEHKNPVYIRCGPDANPADGVPDIACPWGTICIAGECKKSKYPPRNDFTPQPDTDAASTSQYHELNPFDAVSHATPVFDELAQVSWPIPTELPNGDYVMWVEVSKEFDQNATYSVAARPPPTGIPWSEYGLAFRGQPSVVYKIPFTISTVETSSSAVDYVGYGDPDGLDGNLRPPDSTITTDVPGSGASRFALVSDNGSMYRVRVVARPEFDFVIPGAVSEMAVETKSRSASITFVSPGDDGAMGAVKGYEVRYRVGTDPITEANFLADDSIDPHPSFAMGGPGSAELFTIEGLLPETSYSVGIRAFDDCRNSGPLTVLSFTTPERQVGEVDACFVATAAYGSVLAADVEMLRHYRDSILKSTSIGELAIETYYTFSPSIAGIIGESELLRETTRAALTPMVTRIRSLSF